MISISEDRYEDLANSLSLTILEYKRDYFENQTFPYFFSLVQQHLSQIFVNCHFHLTLILENPQEHTFARFSFLREL